MFFSALYNPLIIEPVRSLGGEGYINRIVPILINVGIILCAIAFIVLLIIGGIQYVTSEGDKSKLEGARSKIVNAITGLIILLLLWFILQILNLIFGVNIGGFGPPGFRPPRPTPTIGFPPTPTPPPGSTPTPPGPTPTPTPCVGTKPDLTVEDLARDAANRVTALYCNRGCVTSSETFTVYFYNIDQSRGYETPSTYPFSIPNPGSCVLTGGVTCTLFNACGATNVRATVDYRNTVDEANEGNNTYEEYLTGSGAVGDPCSSGSDCASGLCGQDLDGDTFPGSGSGSCLATGTLLDCNDSNNLVYPGQTQYFETPIGGVGSNYDYDCNGINEKLPRLDCLSAEPHGTACFPTPPTEDVIRPLTGWQDFVPECGQNILTSQFFWSCNASHYNDCSANPEVTENEGCFATCVTGNRCGWGEDQPCISWRSDWWSANMLFSSLGLTRMPCK